MKRWLLAILSTVLLAGFLPSAVQAQDCASEASSSRRMIGSLLSMGAQRMGVPSDYGVRQELTGMLSTKLACALSPRDRVKAAEASTKALEDSAVGVPQSWKSDDSPDVSGVSTAGAVAMATDGRQCRSVTNVGYVNGKEIRETTEHCKTPGSDEWVRTT